MPLFDFLRGFGNPAHRRLASWLLANDNKSVARERGHSVGDPAYREREFSLAVSQTLGIPCTRKSQI